MAGPSGKEPGPCSSARSITEYLELFDRNREQYVRIKEQVEKLCKEKLEGLCVVALVESRVKKRESLAEKLHDRARRYQSEADNVADIKDLVGLQILYRSEREKRLIEQMVRDNFDVWNTSQHPKQDIISSKSRFRGYDAHHFYVKRRTIDAEDHKDLILEIQIEFSPMWTWATWDHEIRYKVLTGKQPQSVHIALQVLLGLGNVTAVVVELIEGLLVSDPNSPLNQLQDTNSEPEATLEMAPAVRNFLLENREKLYPASVARTDNEEPLLDREDRMRFMQWISQDRFAEDHSIIRKQRWPQTGLWMLNHGDFKTWLLSSESKVIWCKGTPGSGKSVLASIVIEHVRNTQDTQEHDVGLAFAYFRHDSDHSREPVRIINALIKQLCCILHTVPEELLNSFHLHSQNATRAEAHESAELLAITIEKFKHVFVILDALDECIQEAREYLLELIWDITMRYPHIKVFVTSRPEQDLNLFFEEFKVIVLSVDARSDIEIYVNGYLDQLLQSPQPGARPRTKMLRLKDTKMRDEICKALVQNANNLFLWVKIQFDILCQLGNDADIRQQLVSLPKGLDNTYRRIMVQIEDQPERNRSLASKCLMWVLRSGRAMDALELREAIAFSEGYSPQLPYSTEYLLECCKNLLVTNTCYNFKYDQIKDSRIPMIRPGDDFDTWVIVRPIHSTLKQYFDGKINSDLEVEHSLSRDVQEIQAEMANICLNYLSSALPVLRGFDPQRLLAGGQGHFVFYCAAYLDKHPEACPNLLLGLQNRIPGWTAFRDVDTLRKIRLLGPLGLVIDTDLFDRHTLSELSKRRKTTGI